MAIKEKKYYQCGVCGFEYDDKKWAERCEEWCEEKGACSVAITAHAVRGAAQKAVARSEPAMGGINTAVFYGLIAVAASLGFALVLYWSLLLNSNIDSLVSNTKNEPFYFWPYIILTFAAIILFGANIALWVYRWRKFGPPKVWGRGGGTGLGSMVSIFASACPTCGSILLAAIGIAGGIAAFPLAGLELKAVSVALLAVPIWINMRDIKRFSCGDADVCPEPKDASFRPSDVPAAYLLAGLIFLFGIAGWNMLRVEPIFSDLAAASAKNNTAAAPAGIAGGASSAAQTGNGQNELTAEIADRVLPPQGFQTKIVLGYSILKLAQNGVISREKFEELYAQRGGLPAEFQNIFDGPVNAPVVLSQQNAQTYVNLLWALGLSNHMETNKESPVNGPSLFNFASTGGWTLGEEKSGGAYFNQFDIVQLTPEQEGLVTRIAKNTYRPCCNNSTFFQDCNHGSAVLGLLQLGAAQGLSEQELYREALAFNSFWFPQQYIEIALYFKTAKNTDWENVDPATAMSKDFSSASGWATNVHKYLQDNQVLPPPAKGGGGCGA